MSTPSPVSGWYKRFMAAMLAQSSDGYASRIAPRKRALLGGLDGAILEIGPGGGPNLPYYAPGVHWIGVEPNPYMHPYLHKTAARHGLAVELRLGTAEALPVADASVDAVVSTLVLCSVQDPARALSEIVRVLKPGGRLLFIEHVAAPADSRLRRVQNGVRPLWSLLGDGCHPNRETGRSIAAAGFAHVQIDYFDMPMPVIRPHISGCATKG